MNVLLLSVAAPNTRELSAARELQWFETSPPPPFRPYDEVVEEVKHRADCGDSIRGCAAWMEASSASCEDVWVVDKCMETCGLCMPPSSPPPPIAPPSPPPPSPPPSPPYCTDMLEDCPEWLIQTGATCADAWVLNGYFAYCGEDLA